VKFKAIRELDKLVKLRDYLSLNRKLFSIDLETSGLDPRREEIVGIGVCWERTGAAYIPLKHKYDQPFDGEEALHIFEPQLRMAPMVAFNAHFDLDFLEYSANISRDVPCIDVSILAYVHGVYAGLSLEAVAGVECPEVGVQSFREFMIAQKLSQTKNSVAEASIDAVADYCGRDTLASFLIYKKLYGKLKDNKIYKLEEKVFPVTSWLRRSGILIDRDFFGAEEKNLDSELENLHRLIEAQITEVAGEKISFNIGSYKQLGNALYDILKLPCKAYTPTGQPKTSGDVLEILKWKQPIVRNIVTYKEIAKRRSTYFKKYVSFIQKDGRIHASYNQTGVPSGRFSCSDPNLQNIPRKETWTIYFKGKEQSKIVSDIRVGFVVPNDCWFLEYDYKQIEARVAAGTTQETTLLEAFAKGVDFHTQTAALIFGVPLNSVTKKQRYLGKTLNFTLIYGAGAGELYRKLNEEMEITYEEADDFRNRYLDSYPRMFHGADMIAKEASSRGYVETYFGRRVPIFGFDSPEKKDRMKAGRIAYNQVVQGTAADILKIGMVKMQRLVQEKFPGLGIKVILSTHDSLSFEVPKKVDLLGLVQEGVQKLHYKLPGYPEFPVDVSIGKNWGSLKDPNKGEGLGDFVERFLYENTGVVSPLSKKAKTYVISFPKKITKEQTRKLKALLRSKPGDNKFIIMMENFEKELSYTSGVGIEDKERIMLYTGGTFYEKFDN